MKLRIWFLVCDQLFRFTNSRLINLHESWEFHQQSCSFLLHSLVTEVVSDRYTFHLGWFLRDSTSHFTWASLTLWKSWFLWIFLANHFYIASTLPLFLGSALSQRKLWLTLMRKSYGKHLFCFAVVEPSSFWFLTLKSIRFIIQKN